MKPFGNRLQPRLRIVHCLIIDTDWKGDCRRFFKSQPIEISGDNAPKEFQRVQKLPKLNRFGVGERKSCPAGHKTQVSPICKPNRFWTSVPRATGLRGNRLTQKYRVFYFGSGQDRTPLGEIPLRFLRGLRNSLADHCLSVAQRFPR
jgi:hypothetical protein